MEVHVKHWPTTLYAYIQEVIGSWLSCPSMRRYKDKIPKSLLTPNSFDEVIEIVAIAMQEGETPYNTAEYLFTLVALPLESINEF